MKPYYTRCACRREIGQTDGAVLIIAGYEIRRPVVFWCTCGMSTSWHPKPRQEPAPALGRLCYTEAVEA